MTAYEAYKLSQQHDSTEIQAAYDEIIDEVIRKAAEHGEYKTRANLEAELRTRLKFQFYTHGRAYTINQIITKEITRLSDLGYTVTADSESEGVYIIAWESVDIPSGATL